MDIHLSTKKILLNLLDECDLILREFLSVVISNEEGINPLKLLEVFIEKDSEMKSLLPQVNEQIKMQRNMDYLKSEIEKRDKMILTAQVRLRKSEIILNTALFYSRKKLNIISTAVANPLDPEEVIKYGHKITSGHGVVAPPNWQAGDKSRPFPTDENIKKGFLGHIDGTGEWAPSLVDFVASNNESRFNALLGLGLGSQTLQSPLSSPRGPQLLQGSSRTPSMEGITHSSSNTSLSQLPPGVNVVSSPNSANIHRGPPLSCSTPGSMFPQHGGSITPDHRSTVPGQSRVQDDVEVMTDSCSSSSSDAFS